MKRRSLSKMIDAQDNLRLSADGQSLEICVWKDGKMKMAAFVALDALFDRDGNYFNRDVEAS